jgi:hypothetical protein
VGRVGKESGERSVRREMEREEGEKEGGGRRGIIGREEAVHIQQLE